MLPEAHLRRAVGGNGTRGGGGPGESNGGDKCGRNHGAGELKGQGGVGEDDEGWQRRTGREQW